MTTKSKQKSTKTKNTKSTKKLYRPSGKDKVLAGVCLGLGEFFDVDPTIVRIIFILLTLFGGGGVLIYIVLWLVMPTEKHIGEISENSIKEGAFEMKERAERFADDMKGIDNRGDSKSIFGLLILGAGVILLFQNFGFLHYINIWRFWPVLLVIVGLAILAKRNE